MIKSKKLTAFVAFFMALLVAATAFAIVRPDYFAPITTPKSYAYASAMDKTSVLSVAIVADEAEWAQMLENAGNEEYIRADVVIDGTRIQNVGIRPKGNSSLSMVASNPDSDRYSFKIEFDHYIEGQNWLGLDKIALNNMQGDSTYMKEYLAYDIMETVGVDAPLFEFADISVNGETWGFYLAVEVLEDSYAQRVFNGEGKLYKPESMGGRGAGRMRSLMEGENQQIVPRNAQPTEINVVPASLSEDGANTGSTTPPDGNRQPDNVASPAMPEGRMDVIITAENETAPSDNEIPAPPDGAENRQGGRREGGGGIRNFMGPAGMGMASTGVSLEYTDDNPDSYSAIFDNAAFRTSAADENRVIRALKALAEADDDELENYVDVDACLRYFAALTFVVNLDSYQSSMGHNYYLYENDGRITILPWDFNLSFGGFNTGNASNVVHFPIDTPLSGATFEDRPLIGRLLQNETYLAQYHEYLRMIVEDYCESGVLGARIDQLTTLISPYVEKDPSAFVTYEDYTASLPVLRELIAQRAKSVQGQLDGTIPSTTEAQNADANALFDVGAIEINALGNQGGGMRMLIRRGEGAIEIKGGEDGTAFDEETLEQMREMGMSEEEITAIQNGGMPQGMPNNGEMTQVMPPPDGDTMRGGMQPPGEFMQMGGPAEEPAPTYSTQELTELGIYGGLLVVSIVFAALFRRRRRA